MVARAAAAARRGRDFLLVTCEHGGNRIPRELAVHFRGRQRLLATHRGYDAGALAMARDLARAFDAPLVASTVSRLVVDLNRSLHNPRAWSACTAALPAPERDRIVRTYYAPHWRRVEGLVAAAAASGQRVVHVASHSFTPVLDGVRRTADVGLLYDPARSGEARLAAAWCAALRASAPHLVVRRNYPYAGKGDGLTRALRQRLPASRYVGIELEINQALCAAGAAPWRDTRRAVIAALRVALVPSLSVQRASP